MVMPTIRITADEQDALRETVYPCWLDNVRTSGRLEYLLAELGPLLTPPRRAKPEFEAGRQQAMWSPEFSNLVGAMWQWLIGLTPIYENGKCVRHEPARAETVAWAVECMSEWERTGEPAWNVTLQRPSTCRRCPTILAEAGAIECGTCSKGVGPATAEMINRAWKRAARAHQREPKVHEIQEFIQDHVSETQIKTWRRSNEKQRREFWCRPDSEQRLIWNS